MSSQRPNQSTSVKPNAFCDFQLLEPNPELAIVLKRLIDAEVGVSQFREVASDLEDAFLSVADGNKSPAVASR